MIYFFTLNLHGENNKYIGNNRASLFLFFIFFIYRKNVINSLKKKKLYCLLNKNHILNSLSYKIVLS
jgi:hypothetical protein